MTQPGRIYLIGFMGSGKTTAGKRLASEIGWHFIDLDSVIEEKYGMPIDRIFMLSGEKTFREYETETLQSLSTEDNTVISVGGGAPCFFGNMDYMKKTGRVVYLKMTPAHLKKRIIEDHKKRPLIKGLNDPELEKFIELRLTDRELYYMKAGIIIDNSGSDLSKLTSKLIKILNLKQK